MPTGDVAFEPEPRDGTLDTGEFDRETRRRFPGDWRVGVTRA